MRSKRKALTIALTVAITSYLMYKVYSEASTANFSLGLFLSRYFFLACLTGLTSYFLYTALWYVYLRKKGLSFGKTLLANLSGTYLGFSLNPAVGFLVKVRLLGTDYWYTFGVSLLAMATEYLSTLLLVGIVGKNPLAGVLAVTLGLAMLFDRLAYCVVYPVFRLTKSLKRLDRIYEGWKEAKDGSSVFLALLIGMAMVLMNATTLSLVGKALGIEIPYGEALKAVLYSTFLGGVLGTPGGIGANELGVTIAIGTGAAEIVTAFLYKALTTYVYALAGAVAFYLSLSKASW